MHAAKSTWGSRLCGGLVCPPTGRGSKAHGPRCLARPPAKQKCYLRVSRHRSYAVYAQPVEGKRCSDAAVRSGFAEPQLCGTGVDGCRFILRRSSGNLSPALHNPLRDSLCKCSNRSRGIDTERAGNNGAIRHVQIVVAEDAASVIDHSGFRGHAHVAAA
jgi:hypothetical protein